MFLRIKRKLCSVPYESPYNVLFFNKTYFIIKALIFRELILLCHTAWHREKAVTGGNSPRDSISRQRTLFTFT